MADTPAKTTLARQVEELQLLKYALLPGELLTFLLPPEEAALWTRALDADTPDPQAALDALGHLEPGRQASPLRFEIALAQTRSVYFEVELPPSRPHPDLHLGAASAPPAAPSVSVRGEQLGREEQLRWQGLVAAKTIEVAESASEYPVYQLIAEHLLPLLHERVAPSDAPRESEGPASTAALNLPAPPYHALLTSHHLVSPTKRRNMQAWSAALRVSGFAKVGHPGVIYCAGAREGVEEFVGNVKAMQWLALRVRFVEPLEGAEPQEHEQQKRRWLEFEKVGDVMEEMRRLGRESYVVEMGIGSAGAPTGK